MFPESDGVFDFNVIPHTYTSKHLPVSVSVPHLQAGLFNMSRSALRPFTALQQARSQALASSSRALTTTANPSTSSDRIRNDSTGSLPLTWPAYLSARRSKKLWSTLTTIPSTFAGLTTGGGYFASIEADPTQTIMGMEPM